MILDIKVCIFLLTYNQEAFIGQTIESLLAQTTDFRYQLVIGEDRSTDNTRQICEKYAREFPEKIKLLPSDRNHGLIQNFIRTYKECDGKYVAICDGDDYWTDPLKLQKQVSFLEKNPEYSIVFTSFKFLFPDGRLVDKNYDTQCSTTTFEDLIFGNYISSVTALFRNKKSPTDFPDWLGTCPYGDWPLYLWTIRDGSKIKFSKDVTAVYRREIGVSEKMKLVPKKIAKENLKIIRQIYKDPNFNSYKRQVKKSLRQHQLSLLAEYYREKNLSKSIELGLKLLFFKPLQVIKMYLYLFNKQ